MSEASDILPEPLEMISEASDISSEPLEMVSEASDISSEPSEMISEASEAFLRELQPRRRSRKKDFHTARHDRSAKITKIS